ncbi:arylphorin subunit alpha-like [Pectinophora gossypiella]|uniref:arylphorin subunit alpha-like n=1 Tax=Pectinophora gossypiella TaxID=13191 RepID=UPI00214F2F6C|nr:arylphorin subunit alpha-like [Pectinophora gossypiella]
MASVQTVQRILLNMLLWFLFMGAALSAPADNKDENNGLEHIVNIRSDHTEPETTNNRLMLAANIKLTNHLQKGHISNNLTFNIYDDNMKDATIAIFNIIRNIDPELIPRFRDFASIAGINKQMYDYAERMSSLVKMDPILFRFKANQPPFQLRPHFYVNAETITKALKLRIRYELPRKPLGETWPSTPVIETLNSNYSHWNDPPEGCVDKLDYFREDIGLNAYYFGIHLLHPHWMSNEELSQLNPTHGEDYYYRHQQLIARYNLEKEGLRQEEKECNFYDSYSYLTYDNGVPFPVRSDIQGEWSEERARLKMSDILLTEYISRGTVVMKNGTIINLTEENHINVLSNVIRAHYDGNSTAKIMRSLYGYGRNGYPLDQYNPAPSLFHQPETCLRDPGYWFIIQYLLNYIKEYQKSIEPFDVSKYENSDIVIEDAEFSPLTTLFENYEFSIDEAIGDTPDRIVSFAVRKRRLNYSPFVFNFNVITNIEQEVVVRLFLGPPCQGEECWEQYRKYFQLDAFKFKLELGENIISWVPENSSRYTTDAMFNKGDMSQSDKNAEYNMYKFPRNLLLPKGVQQGLNLTLFVMITPAPFESQKIDYVKNKNTYYSLTNLEIDDRPLGFPFHMPSKNYKSAVSNYRFYNVTVSHKKRPADDYYFSPHLY